MIRSLLLVPAFLAMTNPLLASDLDAGSAARIDRAVAAAFELQMSPGAVVLAGRAGGNVFAKGYGHFTYDADSTAVKTDTIFDLASLSKPIGCATSIMVLADRGKLAVTDPVSKYLPGMRTDDKKDITIEQCLLHQAGFIADNPIKDYDAAPEEALAKIYAGKLKYAPGKDYIYSDVSFIILGEVVKAVSGQPLDQFAQENVFSPLKMNETSYNPSKSLRQRIAPTEKRDGQWITGEVHDPRAHKLGGVAGHAGVFSTAPDVSRWCRMILNNGELDGVRIMSAKTVKEMTKPRPMKDSTGATVVRAYGLDVDTKHSPAPRGRRFEKLKTFGHTGYTGTSLWIDPVNDAFVILLTNRVHPDDDAEIGMLRKRIATIAAEAMLPSKTK
ncbi:MAG: serine hydrolase domain-containing protein [Tepidisphaeraceae bacterium]